MADLALPRRPAPPPPWGSHRSRALVDPPSSPAPLGWMSEVASGRSLHSGYGAKPEEGQNTKATYPDHHRLLAFEFGDEFVPAEDLRFVEGPEPAHHFDAAFGWIRHLGPRQEGTQGWGRGPGWAAPPRRPRTNRCPLLGRLPQLLSRSSQACAGRPAAPRPGRRAASQLGGPAADLQPSPAPPAHLPATTRRAD